MTISAAAAARVVSAKRGKAELGELAEELLTLATEPAQACLASAAAQGPTLLSPSLRRNRGSRRSLTAR